jgi:hypothetical protein
MSALRFVLFYIVVAVVAVAQSARGSELDLRALHHACIAKAIP